MTPGPTRMAFSCVLLALLTGCATAGGSRQEPPTVGSSARTEVLEAEGAPRTDGLEALPRWPVRFTLSGGASYQFDRVYVLPQAKVSNPSGLTFGGGLPDGRVVLWSVLDGSAVVKDHFPAARTVVRILIDPSGERAAEVTPLELDPRLSICDLEAIERDPVDGGLFVADERAPGEPACGGTGPGGEAITRVFKIGTDGTLQGGPWETGIINTDNNGIEGLAARSEADGTHLYVFEERKSGMTPVVLDYRVVGGEAAAREGRLELMRRFQLDRPAGSTQTAADFRHPDGRLLVVDRDALELLEVDLDACSGVDPVTCLQMTDLKPLTIDALGLITPGNDRNRIGLVEGVATDDTGALYLILDNNGDAYADGDRSARLIRLIPE